MGGQSLFGVKSEEENRGTGSVKTQKSELFMYSGCFLDLGNQDASWDIDFHLEIILELSSLNGLSGMRQLGQQGCMTHEPKAFHVFRCKLVTSCMSGFFCN